MGARQSVAQPPRQRTVGSGTNSDAGPSSLTGHDSTNLGSSHCTNGHTANRYRTGSNTLYQSSLTSAPSTSQDLLRPRQTRSRSVTAPSPDVVRSSSTPLSSNETGQYPNRYRHHVRSDHYAFLTRDQSSDSSGGGTDDTTTVTTGIPSLDRLLRLNSAVVGAASSTAAGQGTAVWLPPFAYRQRDVKCPVCHKVIPSDDVEYHLVVCLTRPKIAYNEDVLTEEKGECVICFEEMSQGDTIARLPCLCVYHKSCIDSWFKVKNCCPEHPGDDD